MKKVLKLLTFIVFAALCCTTMAITATASNDWQGTTDGSNLIQGSYDDKPVKTIKVYGSTADFTIFAVSDFNYEILYYPQAQGTEIFEVRHESLYYYDKVGLKKFYWSDNGGASWNKFTQGPVYYYTYKKTSLYSGSSNICYKIRLGMPPLPGSPDILTFHVKIHK